MLGALSAGSQVFKREKRKLFCWGVFLAIGYYLNNLCRYSYDTSLKWRLGFR